MKYPIPRCRGGRPSAPAIISFGRLTYQVILAMSMYCEPLMAALKECLLQSDCVLKQGHLPSECLRDHTKELTEKCLSLRQATFECKRGMVRMLVCV